MVRGRAQATEENKKVMFTIPECLLYPSFLWGLPLSPICLAEHQFLSNVKASQVPCSQAGHPTETVVACPSAASLGA